MVHRELYEVSFESPTPPHSVDEGNTLFRTTTLFEIAGGKLTVIANALKVYEGSEQKAAATFAAEVLDRRFP